MHGGAVNLRGPHVLADNTAIHAEVVELFAEIFEGRFRVRMPEIRPANDVP
jgi:hypothetical protein